jgi:hypothetical protein
MMCRTSITRARKLYDILTRWHRRAGDGTWLLTGTDERGQKILGTPSPTTHVDWPARCPTRSPLKTAPQHPV